MSTSMLTVWLEKKISNSREKKVVSMACSIGKDDYIQGHHFENRITINSEFKVGVSKIYTIMVLFGLSQVISKSGVTICCCTKVDLYACPHRWWKAITMANSPARKVALPALSTTAYMDINLKKRKTDMWTGLYMNPSQCLCDGLREQDGAMEDNWGEGERCCYFLLLWPSLTVCQKCTE